MLQGWMFYFNMRLQLTMRKHKCVEHKDWLQFVAINFDAFQYFEVLDYVASFDIVTDRGWVEIFQGFLSHCVGGAIKIHCLQQQITKELVKFIVACIGWVPSGVNWGAKTSVNSWTVPSYTFSLRKCFKSKHIKIIKVVWIFFQANSNSINRKLISYFNIAQTCHNNNNVPAESINHIITYINAI